MTSGTGRSRRHRLDKQAFTLIEIVLVLALMAVAGSVVIANFVAFADRREARPPDQILKTAIREARFQAASTRQITTLRYDIETGSLLVEPGTSYKLNADFGSGTRGAIRFYLVPPAEGMAPFPDAERTRLLTEKVRFAPDRSSSPFVAEIDTGNGPPERLIFDPFSSLVRTPK